MKLLYIALLLLPALTHAKPLVYTYHCSIYDSAAVLLRSYPGGYCDFLPDGSLLSADGSKLTLFNKKMEVLWQKTMHVHHMMHFTQDGKKIVALSSYVDKKMRTDLVVMLDLKGNTLRTFMPRYPVPTTISFDFTWDKKYLPEADFENTHLNSIYEIPTNKSKVPAFKAGNFLVNDHFWFTFILDSELKKVLWIAPMNMWGLKQLHDVQVLPSGNLLAFKNTNNDGPKPYSSLEEVNPATNERVWHYQASPPENFLAKVSGWIQRLENGHTLFHNAAPADHVEEVDAKGKLVQKFTIDEKRGDQKYVRFFKQRDLSDFLKNNIGP